MEDEDDDLLDAADADEVIEGDDDVAMDSDDGEQEVDEVIHLQNDSSAHFDGHKDSIFCIAKHPVHSNIVATGGGDDLAYIFDATAEPPPLLPRSYESNPGPAERKSLGIIARIEGHKDSVNAITFTLPKGEFLATAGLDGRLLIWKDSDGTATAWKSHASSQEVEEINWIQPCPAPSHPNAVALGASDGSVWVYDIQDSKGAELNIVQAYYLHTGSCTAGAWTPDGALLATVSEDGGFYVWDPWGEAAAAGVAPHQGGQALVGLTSDDERFKVENGLFSVAVSPGGTLAAVGGAEGMIRVVGLPKIARGGPKTASGSSQVGQILASIQAQTDSIESLSFSEPPTTLLAAASVDGSITIFDVSQRYAMRRRIETAHDSQAVIKVQFLKSEPKGSNSWVLTSCGNDGVVRRWDCRGTASPTSKGLIKEWKGHRGGGEGGGILDFIQVENNSRIITAGDE
jgi:ribosome assembly protein SQT1